MGLDERNVVLYNSKADILSRQDIHAGVAQLVEQLIRNQQVSGSSPLTSSRRKSPETCIYTGFRAFLGFRTYPISRL